MTPVIAASILEKINKNRNILSENVGIVPMALMTHNIPEEMK
jgi:hypothetical protein